MLIYQRVHGVVLPKMAENPRINESFPGDIGRIWDASDVNAAENPVSQCEDAPPQCLAVKPNTIAENHPVLVHKAFSKIESAEIQRVIMLYC